MPRHDALNTRLLTLFCLLAAGMALTSTRAAEFPGEHWMPALPADQGFDAAKLERARDYALTGGGSGCIIRGGKLVFTWGDQRQRYDLKSTTKSFGAAALRLALKDGKMRLSDKVRVHHPALGTPPETNAQTGLA